MLLIIIFDKFFLKKIMAHLSASNRLAKMRDGRRLVALLSWGRAWVALDTIAGQGSGAG